MSNKIDNELNGIKLFGDLNDDVPVESYENDTANIFPTLNLTLMDGLSKQGQASYLSQNFKFAAENDFGFLLGVIAANVGNKQIQENAFTGLNLLTTANGIFLDSSIDNTSAPSKTLLNYDPFRQSIGSVWCLSTRKWSNTSEPPYILDTKLVQRLKNAIIGDPAIAMAVYPDDYTVMNAYSSAHNEIPASSANFSFPSWAKMPYNYIVRGINNIGITRPRMQLITDEDASVLPGSENVYEKEELIYIHFTDSESSLPDFREEYIDKENRNRLKLLSMFFTIDQKSSGYSVPTNISNNLGGLSVINFKFGDNDITGKSYPIYYDATISEEVAENAIFTTEAEQEISTLPDGTQVGSGVSGLTTITTTGVEALTIKVFDGLSRKKYEDYTFNYARAIDKEYSYLFSDSAILGQIPTATITAFYNYLSPAYETVATKSEISELALPNIYEIAELEGYDFEAFGTEILNCANAEVGSLNNDPNSKKKNNIIIPAVGYFNTPGFTFQDSGDLIPDHVEPLPVDLSNKVDSIKDDFPFGIQIEFTGDDHLHSTPVNKSLSLTNSDLKPVHDLGNSPDIAFIGDDIIKKSFSSGIINDFIKTLIYSHFAGDNLANPPNMDPEKFALIASEPEFPNGAQIAKGIFDPKIQYINQMIEPDTVDLFPDLEYIYNEQEDKTEYDFMKWLQEYSIDRQTKNENSILYKNNGDIQKVSQTFGSDDFINFFNSFMSDGWGSSDFAGFMINLHKSLYSEDNSSPDTNIYRSFKECVSELSYQSNGQQRSNQFSIQQTLFYRIKKYNSQGDLIQNIFIPAFGSFLPESKMPDPLYRYIDTQVRYGETYSYNISCYKMVFGTEYEYDYTPYSSDPQNKEETELNQRINTTASKLSFEDTPSEFRFYKQSSKYMPCYRKTYYQHMGGGENDLDGFHGAQKIETDDRLLIFKVKSRPILKIVEVPFFNKEYVAVLDRPPLPPIANIYPLTGKKNDILISFENQTGDEQQVPIPIKPIDNQYFNLERVHQNRAIRDDNGMLINPTLQFKSDDFPSAYEVFRLSGTKPSMYTDFATAEYKKLKVTEETSYVDKIETNTKYYYVFRTIDLHGNISNPTSLYEVEMVEDSGAVYPLIRVVDFASDTPYVFSKNFRRYLKIDASSIQNVLNEEASGIDGTTAYVPQVPPVLGSEGKSSLINNIWNKNRPYKFRIRSKKTGRIIDLNVRFRTRHTNLIEPPNDCNDNLEPGGIITKDVKKYLGSEGEGDL